MPGLAYGLDPIGNSFRLLTISAVVLTLQTAVVLATGELWLFLLQFPLAKEDKR